MSFTRLSSATSRHPVYRFESTNEDALSARARLTSMRACTLDHTGDDVGSIKGEIGPVDGGKDGQAVKRSLSGGDSEGRWRYAVQAKSVVTMRLLEYVPDSQGEEDTPEDARPSGVEVEDVGGAGKGGVKVGNGAKYLSGEAAGNGAGELYVGAVANKIEFGVNRLFKTVTMETLQKTRFVAPFLLNVRLEDGFAFPSSVGGASSPASFDEEAEAAKWRVTLALVIDCSSSMSGKEGVVQEMLLALFRKLRADLDIQMRMWDRRQCREPPLEVDVIVSMFNSRAVVQRYGDLLLDEQVISLCKRFRMEENTNLAAGIHAVHEQMRKDGRRRPMQMLILTDGEDNTSFEFEYSRMVKEGLIPAKRGVGILPEERPVLGSNGADQGRQSVAGAVPPGAPRKPRSVWDRVNGGFVGANHRASDGTPLSSDGWESVARSVLLEMATIRDCMYHFVGMGKPAHLNPTFMRRLADLTPHGTYQILLPSALSTICESLSAYVLEQKVVYSHLTVKRRMRNYERAVEKESDDERVSGGYTGPAPVIEHYALRLVKDTPMVLRVDLRRDEILFVRLSSKLEQSNSLDCSVMERSFELRMDPIDDESLKKRRTVSGSEEQGSPLSLVSEIDSKVATQILDLMGADCMADVAAWLAKGRIERAKDCLSDLNVNAAYLEKQQELGDMITIMKQIIREFRSSTLARRDQLVRDVFTQSSMLRTGSLASLVGHSSASRGVSHALRETLDSQEADADLRMPEDEEEQAMLEMMESYEEREVFGGRMDSEDSGEDDAVQQTATLNPSNSVLGVSEASKADTSSHRAVGDGSGHTLRLSAPFPLSRSSSVHAVSDVEDSQAWSPAY